MSDYRKLYDVIIVGGGPAGLSAAIYAARAKERVLVIEKNEYGGQIALTAKVCNYPGIKECSGRELTDYMKEQAKSFGAELVYGDIIDMDLDCWVKTIRTKTGEYRALGVILAPGSIPRSAGFEGEKEFKGSGVAYCATCDGQLFGGCDLFVVGGGPAAVEEAIYLTKYAKNITLVVREYDFTCAKRVSDRLQLYPNIKVLFHTEIVKVSGEGTIDTVTLIDHVSGKTWEEKAGENPFGVFVFVGYQPNTAWLPDLLEKDDEGYLITDRENKTNIDGVYAAGDVRQKSLRQVVTAASDGAVAAVALEPLVKKLHMTRNIPSLVEEKESISELTKFEEKAILRLWMDDSPLSKEMEEFFVEHEELKECLILEKHAEGRDDILLPSMEICYGDGRSSGIHFHAVPHGLEWNSFQIALFNVAGPGQKLDAKIIERIRRIDRKVNLKILATLTCSNCPTSVMSAGQIAAYNENVSAEMFDLVHFRKLRFKYQVLSVPSLILNDEVMAVGKMTVEEMLDLIEKNIG